MKSNYLRMLGNITVLPPQILPWFLVRDWGSNVPKTSFQESNIIFKSGKKEDCAPSYLCFRLCHLISGLGPVFWFLPHLWCSYSCLGCNTSVCLLPHQVVWNTRAHGWCASLLRAGFNHTGKWSSHSLAEDSAWYNHFLFQCGNNKIVRATLKQGNCFTSCSFKLKMVLLIARSLPTLQGSCRAKENLQQLMIF